MTPLLAILAILTLASVASIITHARSAPTHSQLSTQNHQPIAIPFPRQPFSDRKLAEIFATWPADDERWMAMVQLLETYMHDAQAQAAAPAENDNAYKIAHAHGAWLALSNLQTTLHQLRRKVPSE